MTQDSQDRKPLDIRDVGVFYRDGLTTTLVDRMRAIFKRAGIELRVLGPERQERAPDVVISLGGDGTVLHAVALYPESPILPINFGTIGFLTAGEEEDAEQLIHRLLSNDYYIEERLRLISEFRGKAYEVINEVIVKGTTRLISVEVHVDGDLIHTIRGDGAIVGTPTGSTSYLMATGSSIVAPEVQCIIVNGVNEYRFASRSLILSPDSRLRLRIGENTREQEIFVSHDGRDKLMAEVGDEIFVRRAAEPARLIFFERHSFFRNLKSRLDW